MVLFRQHIPLPKLVWHDIQLTLDDLQTWKGIAVTGLRTGDNVVSTQHGRNAVGLNRRWMRVLAKLDVLKNERVNGSVLELCSINMIRSLES
jgi:hypothetical protein